MTNFQKKKKITLFKRAISNGIEACYHGCDGEFGMNLC